MKIFKALVSWRCSFQEMLGCWQEKGYCEVEDSNDRFSWVDSHKKILLHEHDRVESLPEYDLGLFANQVIMNNKSKPWIYWPRFPRVMQTKTPKKTYENRPIGSLFIGCAENNVQYENRTNQDWKTCVDRFEFYVNFGGNPHKYNYNEYLDIVAESRFGLSLEGYGNKCQREIEYMALGVVPVFTWASFNNYWNPLIEGVHYLYAENPTEAKSKIDSCTKNKWQEMSEQCVLWYNKNCSIEGSFNTTIEILNSVPL